MNEADELSFGAATAKLVPDGIVWTDEDGTIRWCNGAFERLVHGEQQEIVGSQLPQWLPVTQDGASVTDGEHPARLVWRGGVIADTYETTRDGETMILDVYGATLTTSTDRNAMFRFRDITDQVRAETALRALNVQLEAANRELEAFSYSVSHDLRTPLRAIDGFSQAVLEDYGDVLDEQGREDLMRVRRAAQTMSDLIEDLLKLSRLTRADLNRTDVDLGAIAREIADELRAAAPERDVELVVNDDLVVCADQGLITPALRNLLANAWKFTAREDHPRVEVGVTTDELGERVFYVRDNGVGFDMAYADRLFGAFQRLHSRKEFEGSGIGLAIVRRVIHKHGGRIWAESSVGDGATFYFTLPSVEAEE